MSSNKAANGTKSGGGTTGNEKLQSFDILFDDANGIYTWGDEITGQIRIALKEPMKMHMVRLQFKGVTSTGWSEQKVQVLNDKHRDKSTLGPKSSFADHTTHVDKTIDLLERRPGQEVPADFTLPAGVNLLPFSFPLPKKNLPTSFESDCGYVRYFCRAVVNKPWKHDHVTKRPFTVLSPSEFKLASKENFANLHKAAAVSDQVASKSCCCTKGSVSCELSVPKQVYNVGETVTVGAKLVNNSRRSLTKVVFRIVQLITCRGSSLESKGERATVISRVLAEKSYEKPIARSSTAEWHQEKMLKIAPCAPTCVDSTLLRVEYQLRVDVEVANRPKEALNVRLPITIVGAPYAASGDEKVNFRFVECHFGKNNIREDDDNQHTLGQLEFAPLYPTLI